MMGKKSTAFLCALCGPLCVASTLAAADVSVTVVNPLSFGTVAVVNGGTVTVPPMGSPRASPGIYLLPSAPGSAARLGIKTDQPNTSYAITLQDKAVLSTGSSRMTVTPLTSSNSGVTNANGVDTIYIGGTLQVSQAQVPGAYEGSFSVIFNYP